MYTLQSCVYYVKKVNECRCNLYVLNNFDSYTQKKNNMMLFSKGYALLMLNVPPVKVTI